jgi:predicted DNA-binding transcriptional regulator AlpA
MIIKGANYITEKEVSSLYGKSVRWIRKIRYGDYGFPYYKLNGRVYFNQDEIDLWFKDHLRLIGGYN